MWWRSEVEGVLLLPLPVCLQSRFQHCQHVLAPTGALLCCCLIEYAGCCVAAGCESRWGHLSETEEQTGSQTARRYSAGCSLPQSGVLWQLSGRVLTRLIISWSVTKPVSFMFFFSFCQLLGNVSSNYLI